MPDGLVEVAVDIEAGSTPRERPAPRPREPGSPFAILLVGDFRGEAAGAPAGSPGDLEGRRPRAVDRDDLDDVIAAIRPTVRLEGEGVPPVRIAFECLDDFHPDRLLERVPVLGSIRAGDGDVPEAEVAGNDDEGLLNRILEDAPPEPEGPETRAPADPIERARDLRAYVRKVTEPHLAEEPDPDEVTRQRARDRATAAALRGILHDPRFRALEALWRSVAFLVRGLETGTDLRVFVLQATDGEFDRCALDGSLAELLDRTSREVLDGAPWALVVTHRPYGDRPRDLDVLAQTADAAGATGTPFVGEADPSLLTVGLPGGDQDPVGAWERLREHDGARRVCLTVPRFLLRLPYAPGENPCESLDLEELERGRSPEPDRLLWGSPGTLVALLLGTAFGRDGWSGAVGGVDVVEGLPVALHEGPEGTVVLPPTEIVLDDGAIRGLSAAGFTPVAARPGEGTARLGGLRSLHREGTRLEGPWV